MIRQNLRETTINFPKPPLHNYTKITAKKDIENL